MFRYGNAATSITVGSCERQRRRCYRGAALPRHTKQKEKKTPSSCIVKGTCEGDLPKVCPEQEAWDTKREHRLLVCPRGQAKASNSLRRATSSSHSARLDAGAGFGKKPARFTQQQFFFYLSLLSLSQSFDLEKLVFVTFSVSLKILSLGKTSSVTVGGGDVVHLLLATWSVCLF